MARAGGRGWRRQPAGWRAAAGLLALGALAGRPGAAAELNLLFTSSANLSGGEVGGQSTSQHGVTQSLDANYARSVSPVLSYRLRLRGSDNESTTSSGSTSVSSTSRFIEPQVDGTLAGPRYSLTGGVRYRQTFTEGTQAQPLTLTEDHEFLRASYTPELLPALNLSLERTGAGDDRKPAALDKTDTRAVLGATYTLAQKVNLAYTFTGQTNEDHAAQRTQEQRSHVATAGYSDAFFSHRLSVDASYLLNRLDTTERFTPVAAAAAPGGGVVLVPVVLSEAFTLIEFDPTATPAAQFLPSYQQISTTPGTTQSISAPLVTNDSPPPPNKNRSIAVRLAPGATVTAVRLTVSPRPNSSGSLTADAQNVTFQVCASATPNLNINMTTWTCAVPTSVTLPTAANPFFELTFAPVTGNFLKVRVQSDTNLLAGPPANPLGTVSIAAFASTAAAGGPGAAPGRLATGNTIQSLTGGAVIRPLQALTLNANGTFTRSQQDPSGRRDDTGTYSLTASGTPHRLLTATGTYQASFTRSSDPQSQPTDTRLVSLTLSSTPLPTLTASLSGTRSENEQGGVLQNRTTSIGFNTALKPYRNLNVDVTTSRSQAQSFVDGSQTSGFSASVNANAILTARLTGLAGLTFSSSQVTGGAAPSSTTSTTAFLSLTYTVSRFLNANGRWDLSTSAGTYTITQQYRLDVIPTAKTSVLFTLVRTDQQVSGGPGAPGGGAGGGSTTAGSLTARWNISRHLDLNLTSSATRGMTGDTTYSLFGTLAFRL